MQEQIVSLKVAELAKEKGFNIDVINYYNKKGQLDCTEEYDTDRLVKTNWNDGLGSYPTLAEDVKYSAPSQSLLQKWIRETRGVHIQIYRNASGYYWGMCKADSGTDLGWSGDVGVKVRYQLERDTYEEALEIALQVQLSYDLPENTNVIKHWGNYVLTALDLFKIKKPKTE